MIKKLAAFFIAATLLGGCANNNAEIKNAGVAHQVKLCVDSQRTTKELFKKIKIVPLETMDGSYIQEISKIFSFSDTILIADFKQSRILMFNKLGKYLKGITNLGKGPSEYVHIADLTIDQNTKNIFVLDIGGRKILKYNFELQFISAKPLLAENSGYRFESVGENMVFYRNFDSFGGNNSYNVALTDTTDQHLLSSSARIPDFVKMRNASKKPMDVENGSCYILPLHSDTIYKANEKTLSPFCKISISKEIDIKLTKEVKSGMDLNNPKVMEQMVYGNKFYGLDNLVIKEDHIFCSFSYKKSQYLARIDLKTNKVVVVRSPQLEHGLTLEMSGKDSKGLIFIINNQNAASILNKYVGTQLPVDNNPVLVFAESI